MNYSTLLLLNIYIFKSTTDLIMFSPNNYHRYNIYDTVVYNHYNHNIILVIYYLKFYTNIIHF